MNIFYLSRDPIEAAYYHHYNHANKMLLESVQMLSTAHRVYDGVKEIDPTRKRKTYIYPIHNDAHRDKHLYRACYVNHQCNLWVRESVFNYMWLFDLYNELGKRYKAERGKPHKSHNKTMVDILQSPPANMPMIAPPTQVHLGMPDEYKLDDCPVNNYRRLYINDKLFSHFGDQEIPWWVPEEALVTKLDESLQPIKEIHEPLK